MRVLSVLQRNHYGLQQGSHSTSYYPYQLAAILEFELLSREEMSQSVIESSFRMKFAEAVQILGSKGFIFPDPSPAEPRLPDTHFQGPDSCYKRAGSWNHEHGGVHPRNRGADRKARRRRQVLPE